MFQIHIRVLAKEDIQQVVDYYDLEAPHITDRFLESLYNEFDVITKNPALFQKKYKNTRVRYIKGFPFGIHYILKENIVEVLTVLHTKRDLKSWKNRELN